MENEKIEKYKFPVLDNKKVAKAIGVPSEYTEEATKLINKLFECGELNTDVRPGK